MRDLVSLLVDQYLLIFSVLLSCLVMVEIGGDGAGAHPTLVTSNCAARAFSHSKGTFLLSSIIMPGVRNLIEPTLQTRELPVMKSNTNQAANFTRQEF